MVLELALLGGDSHHPISVEVGVEGSVSPPVGVGVKRGVWLVWLGAFRCCMARWTWFRFRVIGVSICDSVGGALGSRHLRFGGRACVGPFWLRVGKWGRSGRFVLFF